MPCVNRHMTEHLLQRRRAPPPRRDTDGFISHYISSIHGSHQEWTRRQPIIQRAPLQVRERGEATRTAS